MLILSRHSGESIVIPLSDITVTVVALSGKRVKLGVTAPPQMAVFRDEVWRRMQLPEADGMSHVSTALKAGSSD